MCQLIESIRIENRQLHHIDLHNNRFNVARKNLFGASDFIKLEEYIKIPESIGSERHKCRVTTNGNSIVVEIAPYHQRTIKTLKVVFDNSIDYTIKTTNRLLLDAAFAKREHCDDVIIVKNEMITDSWAANIILFDGTNWVSPKTPLLKGIQREFLLQKNLIQEKDINIKDLKTYKKIKLINALIDFERASDIYINSVIF